MSCRKKIDPTEIDRFVAAGRQRFKNFDQSHRNVRGGLDREFRQRNTSVYRTLFSVAAALLLLVVCLFLFNRDEEGSYLALAEELSTPFSTETLSVKRGADGDAGSDSQPAVQIARAISFYHGGEPLRAAPLWHELAANATPDRRDLFRFYEATAYWLADYPAEAIDILVPLVEGVPEHGPFFRKCRYALGLAYLDVGEARKAIPHFAYVLEIKDKIGKASAELLAVLEQEKS